MPFLERFLRATEPKQQRQSTEGQDRVV